MDRTHIDHMIDMGFDPFERGASNDEAGESLYEHLKRTVDLNDKNGQMLATLEARLLDASTPARAPSRFSKRL